MNLKNIFISTYSCMILAFANADFIPENFKNVSIDSRYLQHFIRNYPDEFKDFLQYSTYITEEVSYQKIVIPRGSYNKPSFLFFLNKLGYNFYLGPPVHDAEGAGMFYFRNNELILSGFKEIFAFPSYGSEIILKDYSRDNGWVSTFQKIFPSITDDSVIFFEDGYFVCVLSSENAKLLKSFSVVLEALSDDNFNIDINLEASNRFSDSLMKSLSVSDNWMFAVRGDREIRHPLVVNNASSSIFHFFTINFMNVFYYIIPDVGDGGFKYIIAYDDINARQLPAHFLNDGNEHSLFLNGVRNMYHTSSNHVMDIYSENENLHAEVISLDIYHFDFQVSDVLSVLLDLLSNHYLFKDLKGHDDFYDRLNGLFGSEKTTVQPESADENR